MKHQLKELRACQLDNQIDDFHVREEELFEPLEVQEEVKKNFGQGFVNPAAGLKKKRSTPVTTEEVAESRGEAMLEWMA
eukprot:10563920-Prorocentrum_lima.AAC.1